MEEIEVVDFPGYYVRSNGEVIGKRGRVLKPKITWDGYQEIILSDGSRRKSIRVHRLVAACFFGDCPDGIQVNHKDGNKQNNSVENLEYVTLVENSHHAYRTGLHKTNTLCNLSYLDFHKMLDMYLCGFSYADICDYFDLTINRADYIGEILSGRKLSEITGFDRDMRNLGQTTSKKYSDAEVETLILLRKSGKTYKEIQEEIPMSLAQISRILNGKRRSSNV